MLSGRKTAQSKGVSVKNRDEIYTRICDLGEGTLFRIEDVTGGDDHLVDDFVSLRGCDYDHLSSGWYVGIVETQNLRRLPNLQSVMASYCHIHTGSIVETGDRVAWRMGIKTFEPILGFRFYTDGADDFLAYGYMGIRLLNAPAWLREEDDRTRLLRVFHDTPAKEMTEAVVNARGVASISDDTLLDIAEFARSMGQLREEEKTFWPWLRCPVEIGNAIEDHVRIEQKKAQENRKK